MEQRRGGTAASMRAAAAAAAGIVGDGAGAHSRPTPTPTVGPTRGRPPPGAQGQPYTQPPAISLTLLASTFSQLFTTPSTLSVTSPLSKYDAASKPHHAWSAAGAAASCRDRAMLILLRTAARSEGTARCSVIMARS